MHRGAGSAPTEHWRDGMGRTIADVWPPPSSTWDPLPPLRCLDLPSPSPCPLQSHPDMEMAVEVLAAEAPALGTGGDDDEATVMVSSDGPAAMSCVFFYFGMQQAGGWFLIKK